MFPRKSCQEWWDKSPKLVGQNETFVAPVTQWKYALLCRHSSLWLLDRSGAWSWRCQPFLVVIVALGRRHRQCPDAVLHELEHQRAQQRQLVRALHADVVDLQLEMERRTLQLWQRLLYLPGQGRNTTVTYIPWPYFRQIATLYLMSHRPPTRPRTASRSLITCVPIVIVRLIALAVQLGSS